MRATVARLDRLVFSYVVCCDCRRWMRVVPVAIASLTMVSVTVLPSLCCCCCCCCCCWFALRVARLFVCVFVCVCLMLCDAVMLQIRIATRRLSRTILSMPMERRHSEVMQSKSQHARQAQAQAQHTQHVDCAHMCEDGADADAGDVRCTEPFARVLPCSLCCAEVFVSPRTTRSLSPLLSNLLLLLLSCVLVSLCMLRWHASALPRGNVWLSSESEGWVIWLCR